VLGLLTTLAEGWEGIRNASSDPAPAVAAETVWQAQQEIGASHTAHLWSL
jgi:hypothetical protein